jgi:uncharacterized protein YhbP (UPF0306 family)
MVFDFTSDTGIILTVSPSKDQIKRNIYDFLKNHGIMTLATAVADQPWVATQYYGIDTEMNLYILTDPAARHAEEFLKNPQVAFNVFDSDQKISDPVKNGIQGTGAISPVKGLTANTKALLLWHQANPGIESRIGIKDLLKKVTDTRIYKITPNFMKHFNKSLYPETKYGLLEL